VDAVVAKSVRATMILEDVWKMTPKNTELAKIIGEYFPCVPAILIVRKDLAPEVLFFSGLVRMHDKLRSWRARKRVSDQV
jgi:hypothetical protein